MQPIIAWIFSTSLTRSDLEHIPHSLFDSRLWGGLPDTGPEDIAQAVNALAAKPDQTAVMALHARQRVIGYTLEAWRNAIGEHLQKAWGPIWK